MLEPDLSAPFYPDLDGKPLQGGKAYFGIVGQNPVTSPITVYWDAAGIQPAAQPIAISNGRPMRNGNPARVYVPGAYSRLVLNALGKQVVFDSVAANGFSLDAVGAALRSTFDKLGDSVNAKDFGVKGDGLADDTAAVANLLAFATLFSRNISFDGLQVVKITSPVTMRLGNYGVDFAGCKIDASAITAGYAWSFVPYASSNDIENGSHRVVDFWLAGASSEANNADGVYMGQGGVGGGTVSGHEFFGFHVQGFRDNLFLSDFTYILNFYNPQIMGAWRRNINVDALATAGENYNFHGGRIADAHKSDGSAVGIYTNPASNADLVFFGTSVDYNDQAFQVQGAQVSFVGCHLEDNAPRAMGVVTFAAGSPSSVKIIGGKISPTNVGGARDHLFEASGGRANIEIDAAIDLFGYSYEVVKVTSGAPSVRINNNAINSNTGAATTPANPSNYTNVLNNPGAELNTTEGWTQSKQAGVTFAPVADPSTGGFSFQITGTGAAGNSAFSQRFACKPGDRLLASLTYKCTMNAGGFEPLLLFFDGNGDAVSAVGGVSQRLTGGAAVTASVAAYTKMGTAIIVPPGACIVEYAVRVGNGFNGSITFDDCLFHGPCGPAPVFKDRVSVDNGDASVTLTLGSSQSVQRWSTPLTADRAVTLSTTNAENGDEFLIVRSAGGAFNLNVGTGPLKAMPAGSWARLKFDGAAWFLASYGAL